MVARIRLRRDIAQNWFNINPKLLLGEAGIETDTLKFKIGNGEDLWNDLSYMTGGGLTLEEIEDSTANDFFVSGTGIYLDYSDSNNILTINTSGLIIGTDVQAYDAGLTSIAGLTTGSGNYIYATASDVYTTGVITAFGRSLVDDVDASAGRTTLGLGSMATQASGDYSLSSHTHSLSIGNGDERTITYLTTDRLDIVGGGNTSISYSDSSNKITISSTTSNETIDDRVANLLTAGTGISLSYNDSGNSLTINITGVPNEIIDDRVSNLLVAGSGITLNYNDSNNTLTINSSGTSVTGETIDDRVAGLLIAGTGISLNYNDTANSLTVNTSGINRLGNTPKISVGGTYSVGVNLDNTSRTLSQNNTLSIMGGTVGIQTLTPVYELDIVGTVRSTESVSIVIKPTISSSQNNWDPGDGAIIRVSASNSSLNITGLVAGVDGQRKLLYNGGTRDVTLVNSSSSSTASNRFLMFSGSNYILNPNAAVELLYDTTSARWRIFGFVDAPTATGGGGGGGD